MTPTRTVRCLVVGRQPAPDLELVRRLAGDTEFVGPGADAAGGEFDCIWRLYGGRLQGVREDPLEAALQAHPEVRWVHTISAGIDHLRPLMLAHPEVVLTTSVGVMAAPIAEFVVGCLLQHCKCSAELAEMQRAHRFTELPLRELGDMRIVIVGLGAIGSQVATLASAFGSSLVGVRRRAELGGGELIGAVHRADELELACRGADALVLAAPLTEASRGLVGDRVLGALNEGSVLVNVARGALVDEEVLLRRLRSGPLRAAYLDAFEEEPLPPSSPLWEAQGVFVSPHVSWSSPNFPRRACELFGEQLRRYREGRPLLNVADVAAGY